jgi:hypothetical protein
MAYRSMAWLMSQAAAAPTANPTAGPSRRTCTENSAQSATPDASALATAIRIRSMGKTTTSLVPASMFRAWRTERGMRPLRTTSRRTTGSVEARMVPRSSDSTIEVPSKKYDPAATTETMIRVPGPRESTGTAPAPSMLSLPILTPSRQRTRASVSVATDSRSGFSGPSMRTPRPCSPSKNPKLRKIIGKEIGARSTSPEARPAMVRTTAIKAKVVSKSGKGVSPNRGSRGRARGTGGGRGRRRDRPGRAARRGCRARRYGRLLSPGSNPRCGSC